jgi:hypothetical protein
MKMVSLEGGAQDFFTSERFVTSSRYDHSSSQAGERQQLESVSLQALLHQLKPSFLIMDIEGAEADLASESLDLHSLKKLCIEMHPQIIGDQAVTQIIANLVAKGFMLRMRECRDDVLFFSRAA